MCAVKRTKIKDQPKEIARIAFRLHGPELASVREVKDMLSLNSELDATRYLMQRGLEAMSATLASRRASASMASGVNAEALVAAMIPKLQQLEKEGKL